MGVFVVVPGLNRWLMRLWLPLVLLVSPAAVRSQIAEAPAEAAQAGLLTIESDQQSANSSTGVITASGNVRLVHADRGLVATGRQAQYFSREQRIVLSGVDVVQTDGHTLRADQVTVLLDEQRTLATTSAGQQVTSSWSLQDPGAVVAQ